MFNVKKILAVQVATYTVAKRRLEEIQPYTFPTSQNWEGKLECFEAFNFV